MIHFLTNAENRNFLRLWLAQLISQFGDRIYQLALVGLIAERSPGSAMDLAKLIAFTIIPVFVVQPFAGVLVDRFDRRTTLFVCDLIRGGLVLLIPFALMSQHSMVPIYAVVFLVFCFSRFYVPAKMSIIPDLVESASLLHANSLITTTGMIAAALGGAFGAFLIEYYGARTGFIIDAVAFFISAVFLFNMNIPWKLRLSKARIIDRGREVIRAVKQSIFEEIKEGIVYLIRHKELRFVISMIFLLFGAAGAIYVVLIVFVQETFGSVTKDLGILMVSLVVGLFVGVIFYGRVGKHFLWYRTIYMCLMGGGMMLVACAVFISRYPNILFACGLTFILGLTIGPIFIATNTMVHLFSDEHMRGKVFSALEVIIHLAFLIMLFISSWLSHHLSSMVILVMVGGICAVVGLAGWMIRPNANMK